MYKIQTFRIDTENDSTYVKALPNNQRETRAAAALMTLTIRLIDRFHSFRPTQRILIFIASIVLLVGMLFTLYAGVRSLIARRWFSAELAVLNIEVELAGREAAEGIQCARNSYLFRS